MLPSPEMLPLMFKFLPIYVVASDVFFWLPFAAGLAGAGAGAAGGSAASSFLPNKPIYYTPLAKD